RSDFILGLAPGSSRDIGRFLGALGGVGGSRGCCLGGLFRSLLLLLGSFRMQLGHALEFLSGFFLAALRLFGSFRFTLAVPLQLLGLVAKILALALHQLLLAA